MYKKALALIAFSGLGTAMAHDGTVAHVHPHGLVVLAIGLAIGVGVFGAVKLGMVAIKKDK